MKHDTFQELCEAVFPGWDYVESERIAMTGDWTVRLVISERSLVSKFRSNGEMLDALQERTSRWVQKRRMVGRYRFGGVEPRRCR